MASAGSPEVTELLKAWGKGDPAALDRLTPLVFSELHRIARHHMRLQRRGNTLQTTALVNEAYIHLVNVQNAGWQDRVHFFAISAKIMRRILVDRARARGSAKRNAGIRASSIDLDQVPALSGHGGELVAVDDALNALERFDSRKARVIELRFFGGLSVEETAEALAISPQSVMRDWKLAKSWLMRELRGTGAISPLEQS
jgi:RNA polymerase sigma factor (TIGR02999 family)